MGSRIMEEMKKQMAADLRKDKEKATASPALEHALTPVNIIRKIAQSFADNGKNFGNGTPTDEETSQPQNTHQPRFRR